MAAYEHLISSYNVCDQPDDIGSANLPAFLRRCFAEGYSASALSWKRVQQFALCAMVLDAIANERGYGIFERELIADWRIHYSSECTKLQITAAQALPRVLERDRPQDPDAVAELEQLASSVGGA